MVTEKGFELDTDFFSRFSYIFQSQKDDSYQKMLTRKKQSFDLFSFFYADALPYKITPIILESLIPNRAFQVNWEKKSVFYSNSQFLLQKKKKSKIMQHKILHK